MRLERLGEKAVILRELPREPYEVARVLNASWRGEGPAKFEEAVASYETVGLYFSEPISGTSFLEDAVSNALSKAPSTIQPNQLTIQVCYELGEDLQACASSLGMTSDELIDIHLNTRYRCYAVGFSPGFAYLGYLDERIASLPRLSSPRKKVEPGSVGITGRQTAVYPSATPGGWNLIGRCPFELVNLEDGYFAIEPGDHIRFWRIDEGDFEKLKGVRL